MQDVRLFIGFQMAEFRLAEMTRYCMWLKQEVKITSKPVIMVFPV